MRIAPGRIPHLRDRGLRRVLSGLVSISPEGQPEILCDQTYFRRVLTVIVEDDRRAPELRAAAEAVLLDATDRSFWWLLDVLGVNTTEGSAPTVRETETKGMDRDVHGDPIPVVLYLEQLRSPFNVGNIIRSAAAFGIVGVVLGEACPALNHPRLVRAAMGGPAYVSCIRGDLDSAMELCRTAGAVPDDPVDDPILYALETGGPSIRDAAVKLPAVVVLGHEQYGVSRELRERAGHSGGILTIDHDGRKRSLNVGVAAGILLHHLSGEVRDCNGSRG